MITDAGKDILDSLVMLDDLRAKWYKDITVERLTVAGIECRLRGMKNAATSGFEIIGRLSINGGQSVDFSVPIPDHVYREGPSGYAQKLIDGLALVIASEAVIGAMCSGELGGVR